jgi:branched-subunit amino acid transport protein
MIWATMAVAALVTFLLRFSVIYRVKSSNLPGWLENILKYVPTSVFAALIFPAVFLGESGSLEFIGNPKVLAALAALAVAILMKNVIITITTGMIVLWALTLI